MYMVNYEDVYEDVKSVLKSAGFEELVKEMENIVESNQNKINTRKI